MRRTLYPFVVMGAVAFLAACSSPSGTAETDRVATVVATAISYPRHDSMDGYIRAALATAAGLDSRLAVIEAEEIHAEQLVDPLARLTFRVTLPASSTGFDDPVIACYRATFSYYGVIGSPHRLDCPTGTPAIVPAALPPKAHAAIPLGSDAALRDVLAALPAEPRPGDVASRISGALPPAEVDPSTGLTDLPPTIDTAIAGPDVGVSLWDQDSKSCLLGARSGGTVSVWWLSWPSLHAGDAPPCNPQTAIHLLGSVPPH
ncbi:MAG: hypothetical protein ABIV94_09785 [Acidimicrobiales bacterium]